VIPPIPHSVVPEIRWPAFATVQAAEMLALQYQFLQAERMPAAELRARQFAQLDALVEFCIRTIPFHRDRLKGAGQLPNTPLAPGAFARLPVLTRAEAAQAGSRLISLSVPSAHGGTMRATIPGPGGRPFTIAGTGLHALFNDAYMLRDLLWHDVDFRGKWGRITHDPATVSGGARGARERSWAPAIAAVFDTGPGVGFDSERPPAEQAAWLTRERPDYLSAPPQSLARLATQFRASGQKPPRLRALRCDGACPADVAQLCQDVFGCKPVAAVLLPETGCLALQCPEHGALHVMAEGLVAEVLDPSGQACAPGQAGRLVVTPLHNFAMPLLRYDTGFTAAFGPPCACGRSLPVLAGLSLPPAAPA